MAVVLVGTQSGCRTFRDGREVEIELVEREVSALSPAAGGSCLAVVDGRQVWRRDFHGAWSHVAATDLALQSLTSVAGVIFAGAMDDAAILRITESGQVERLKGFDNTEGRSEWFAGGPPLGVRSLTATVGGEAILAAVHVGGIPRSTDRGECWAPTIPVMFDVHEVKAHRSRPTVIAAAAAVGLCLSHDAGLNWTVFGDGFEDSTSLAVAVLEDEVLFSVQDGPFATRSQVWRCDIEGGRVEQVRDGLPEWLDGKIDTGWIASGGGRVAIADGGGSLWQSAEGSIGWERISTGLPYVCGLAIL